MLKQLLLIGHTSKSEMCSNSLIVKHWNNFCWITTFMWECLGATLGRDIRNCRKWCFQYLHDISTVIKFEAAVGASLSDLFRSDRARAKPTRPTTKSTTTIPTTPNAQCVSSLYSYIYDLIPVTKIDLTHLELTTILPPDTLFLQN